MTEKKDVFYKDGLHFGCQRCSFCCGHSPGFVYLSLRDLTALRTHLNMSVTDFVQTYCRWADYYYGDEVLALLEKKNYDCILWNNGCSCYEARPVQCSTYPFWSWMIKDKETWDECAADCPGMRNQEGKLWSYEEIEAQKKAYDANRPLRRAEVEAMMEKEKSGTNRQA
ncbi:MAG: YkgJ family cysteine cluster protein [Treponema sp.]|nr:YkgJ family cysteine cluster protein [Treponema sp.]